MSVFSNNDLTDVGRQLHADLLAGAIFTPTRIVMGSGSMPSGTTVASMTDVITEVKSLTINKKRRTNDGKFICGGYYKNNDISAAFYFRELALYAKAIYLNADGSVARETDEILYSYGNAGATADLMAPYSTATAVERQIDLVTWVGSTAQINLTVDSGLHIPYTEKGTPDGVATLDESGKVPEEQLPPIDPASIGAAFGAVLVTEGNLLEWALAQTVGGPFFTLDTVTGVPFAGFWQGFLTMGTATGDRGILIFNSTSAHIISTMASTFDNSNWDELLTAHGNSTIGGSLSVNHGSGTFLSWLNDTTTGAAIDAYLDEVSSRLEVQAFKKDGGGYDGGVYFTFFDGALWHSREVLHTGNSPTVIADAELE